MSSMKSYKTDKKSEKKILQDKLILICLDKKTFDLKQQFGKIRKIINLGN